MISNEDLLRLGFKRLTYDLTDECLDFFNKIREDKSNYLSYLPNEILLHVMEWLKYDKKEIMTKLDGSYYILIECAELTMIMKNEKSPRLPHIIFIDVPKQFNDENYFISFYLCGFNLVYESVLEKVYKSITFNPSDVSVLDYVGTTDKLGQIIQNTKKFA